MNLAARPIADPLAFGPRTPYERDAPIQAVFASQVARTPDAPALVDAAGTLSYAELERRANRLARYLRAVGITPGSAIGVAFERSRNFPITLLAILKAGCAYVPLDATYPAERIAFIINDAAVAAVVVDGGGDVERGFARTPVIDLAAAAPAIAAQSPTDAGLAVAAQSPAYIMYTSGSTGRPKGVAVAHRGVVRLVRGVDYFRSGGGETFLHLAPAAFDASTFELWGALLNGARLAVPRPGLLSIEELGAAVAGFGVTTLWLTASIFARVVEAQLPSFAGLRQLLTGGSAGSARHMLRFLALYPDCRLIAGYGPTENTTFSTSCHLASADLIGTNPPIGRPIANSSAHVLDDALQPVPAGTPGELWVGGDGVALGYVNLPVETAARFVPDPFSALPAAMLYRTGDRVRLRADGLLEFLGRTDDQVKVHGFRIELGEIEAVLRAHPDLRDAAVVAISAEDGEKTLCAQVVPAAGARLDEQLVREYLRVKLPAYMVPPRIVLVAELPLHPSGKIDRVAVAAAAARSASLRSAAPLPVTPSPARARQLPRALVHQAVAAIWRAALDDDAARDAAVNFFDAGGDSLRLLRLRTLLNERFDVNLTVLDLFEHTTITQITDYLAAAHLR